MRIIFFGTPQFSAQVLKYLVEKGVEVLAVVTQPDKIGGRHLNLQEPAVKKMANRLSLNVPILQPHKISTDSFLETIKPFNADILVVVAFGQIFPTKLLDLPRLGCVNVHTSLLPKYRGAAPIQRCLMAGEKETGVSIMYMVKALDAGDVLATKKIEIESSMNAETLTIALCDLSKELLYQTLLKLDQGKIQPVAQGHDAVTYAKKVTPKDAEILWENPAIETIRQYRGVSPKPGAWCQLILRGKLTRLKLLDITFSPLVGKPSEIISYDSGGIIIGTSAGAVKILRLQLEGKKGIEAKEFVKGYSVKDISFSVSSEASSSPLEVKS